LLDLGVSLERGERLHREILITAVDHVQLQVVNLQKAPSFTTKTLVDVGAWASGAASSERGEQRERDVPQSRTPCRQRRSSRPAKRCPC
jgi:hypothetical protein